MLSKPLLTTQETAELLKVSEATVRTWIRAGEIRAIRFGREWRLAVKDLEAFVNARATRQPEAPPTDPER
jgi:excisionase family DNA binding protein